MTNEFIFHGVGQGLFYSGHIADGAFNFVYDCGSKNKNLLKKELSNSLSQNQDIDFVAISHLDDDHVNGLYNLLTTHTVKKIYLPYFDAKTYKNPFIVYLIAQGVYPSHPLFPRIMRWYGCDYNDYFLFNMQTERGQRNLLNDREDPDCIITNEDCDEPKFSQVPYWQFKFYNLSVSKQTLQAFQTSIEQLLDNNNQPNIESYILGQEGDYRELKKLYKNINRPNLTSLVLMHWKIAVPTLPTLKTLLTGDITFDKTLTNKIINDIGKNDELVFQIPHHGATAEWKAVNNRIINKSRDLVVSYGINNKYGHPSIILICDCYFFKILHKLRFVCEDNGYIYTM